MPHPPMQTRPGHTASSVPRLTLVTLHNPLPIQTRSGHTVSSVPRLTFVTPYAPSPIQTRPGHTASSVPIDSTRSLCMPHPPSRLLLVTQVSSRFNLVLYIAHPHTVQAWPPSLFCPHTDPIQPFSLLHPPHRLKLVTQSALSPTRITPESAIPFRPQRAWSACTGTTGMSA